MSKSNLNKFKYKINFIRLKFGTLIILAFRSMFVHSHLLALMNGWKYLK